MKEKKEVINLSRRSSGGGWRSDGLGQNFWDGAFKEGKIAFIGRQVGSSHVLLSEAYTLDCGIIICPETFCQFDNFRATLTSRVRFCPGK